MYKANIDFSSIIYFFVNFFEYSYGLLYFLLFNKFSYLYNNININYKFQYL